VWKWGGQSLEGHFAHGSVSSREREGQGAKVPGNKLARVLLADSLRGANWPGSKKAMNGSVETLRQTNRINRPSVWNIRQ